LACKNNRGVWKLVGISSYVSSYCNWTARPNVFTDVQHYIPWIKNVTSMYKNCNPAMYEYCYM